MKRNKVGFMVFEFYDEYEQALGLLTGDGYPAGGILHWHDRAAFVFPTRQAARAAINRTEHYRLAFSDGDAPVKQQCKIVPIESEATTEG